MTETSTPDAESTSYDVVVIGAGPAGENAADYAVENGLTTAIIESELVGGECSYWGCMPSKALLRPTEALAAARRVAAAAAAITGGVAVQKVFANRDAFTSNLDDQVQVDWLEGAGVTLVRGHGRIVGDRQVEVSGADGTVTTLHATRGVVIGVGTRASEPPIPGLAETVTWAFRPSRSHRLGRTIARCPGCSTPILRSPRSAPPRLRPAKPGRTCSR